MSNTELFDNYAESAYSRYSGLCIVLSFMSLALIVFMILLFVVVLKVDDDQKLIGTFGDSITDSRKYGDYISPNHNEEVGGWYQYYMFWTLKVTGLVSKIYDFGIGGQKSDEICKRLRFTVGAYNFEYIVILAGINDIFIDYKTKGVSKITHDILWEYNYTIERVRKYYTSIGHQTKFVVCSITPVSENVDILGLKGDVAARIVNQINPKIEDLVDQINSSSASEPVVKFCNIHKVLSNGTYYLEGLTYDGIHPSESGNQILGEEIAKCIL